jgi:hypothetical protein
METTYRNEGTDMNTAIQHDESTDVCGTSLSGYITASYADLAAAFGDPARGEFDKTDAEWHMATPAGPVTIYNWKNGPSYGYDIEVEAITDWNVGSKNRDAVAYIEAAGFTVTRS